MSGYPKSAAIAYQRAQVNTIDQLALVIMLYEGALRFLKQSLVHIDNKNIEHAHLLIIRAKDIIAELLSSVDKKQGGKIAEDLVALYAYMFRQLVEANLAKNKQQIDNVILVLTNLLAGWKGASKNRKNPGPGTAQDEELSDYQAVEQSAIAMKQKKSINLYG